MKHVLGFDNGYGDNKVVYGTPKSIISMNKFNSVLARVDLNSNVKDARAEEYKGDYYYIGDLALKVESSKIIDLLTYSNLEKYAPLMIKHAINEMPEVPSIVVCGLSIAHIDNSAYFKEAISKYLIDDMNYPIQRIEIIPQGVGGKLTYDKYGTHFPNENRHVTEFDNYIGCDIGFNTLDVFQVIEGKVSTNLIRGIENQGIVKIVSRLLTKIAEKYEKTFTMKEGKQIFDNGYFKVRGTEYSVSDIITEIKQDYLKELKVIIEDNFGQIMDKVDVVKLFGGGAYVFKSINDPFFEVPEVKSEYYNSIGQYLYGVSLLDEKQ